MRAESKVRRRAANHDRVLTRSAHERSAAVRVAFGSRFAHFGDESRIRAETGDDADDADANVRSRKSHLPDTGGCKKQRGDLLRDHACEDRQAGSTPQECQRPEVCWLTTAAIGHVARGRVSER